nr:uncharacterized protein LOC129487009 [Symphalangus syndactylus]
MDVKRTVFGFQVSAPACQAALHLRGIALDSALWIFRFGTPNPRRRGLGGPGPPAPAAPKAEELLQGGEFFSDPQPLAPEPRQLPVTFSPPPAPRPAPIANPTPNPLSNPQSAIQPPIRDPTLNP